MSKTVFLYLLRTYALFFGGLFVSILAVYLVVDFADRAQVYSGAHWIQDAAVLYGYKALIAIQQLGPAILLLASATAVSSLRKRGEVTALRALGFGPSAIFLPVGFCALGLAFSLVAFDDWVAAGAGLKAEEIQTKRFDVWGDWRFYFQPNQWFRRGDRILFLRQGDPDEGFTDVTLLQVNHDFELVSRIDAPHMWSADGTRWKLKDVVERAFRPDGTFELHYYHILLLDLDVTPEKLRIRPGRPEQMRMWEIREQIRARRTVGLPVVAFRLAMHTRYAYPLAGVPAAILAAGLALRPGRKGHVTTAVVEGLGVAVTLWGFLVICKTLALTDRLGAGPAAWTPLLIIGGLASLFWVREEGGSWRAAR